MQKLCTVEKRTLMNTFFPLKFYRSIKSNLFNSFGSLKHVWNIPERDARNTT